VLPYLPDSLYAILFGHSEIHEDDVGGQAPREADSLLAVGGLSDDGETRVLREHAPHADSDDRVVIADQQADIARDGLQDGFLLSPSTWILIVLASRIHGVGGLWLTGDSGRGHFGEDSCTFAGSASEEERPTQRLGAPTHAV
jgi:hypothetical protein